MSAEPEGDPRKLVAPAAERNKHVIAAQLQRIIFPESGVVVEVASGTGQHVGCFARQLAPALQWQPTEVDAAAFGSIAAHCEGLDNVRAPLVLDASAAAWPAPLEQQAGQVAAVLCINMTHIAPWAATLGLLRGAGRLLRSGGVLALYGPFMVDGVIEPESNVAFDRALRQRNPLWGYRDLEQIKREARAARLAHVQTVPMPANNHLLVLRRE